MNSQTVAPFALVSAVAALSAFNTRANYVIHPATWAAGVGVSLHEPRFGKKRTAKQRNKAYAKGKK